MVSIPFDNRPSVPTTDTVQLTTTRPVSDDEPVESFESHLRADEEKPAAPVDEQPSTPSESSETADSSNKTNETATGEQTEQNEQEPDATEPKTETENDETPVVVQTDELLSEVKLTSETTEGDVEVAEVVDTGKAVSRATKAESELIETTDAEPQTTEQTQTTEESETQLLDVKEKSTTDKPATVDDAKVNPTDSITAAANEQTEEAVVVSPVETEDETPQRRDSKQQNQLEKPLQETAVATQSDSSSEKTSSEKTKSGGKREVRQIQAPEPTSDRPANSTTNTSDESSAPVGRSPQNLLARTSRQSTSEQPISRADQARFVHRVARAFEAARNQGGPIRLRLSPPELGSLQLEVRVQSGVMTARIEVDTATARTLLVDNLSVLRERLSEQGIEVERFEVDVPDRQQGELPDDPRQHNRRNSRSSNSTSQTQETQPDTTSVSVEASDQLNVVV